MEKFGYVGAYVEEREKLIEDGVNIEVNEDGEMDTEHKERRNAQSDMVFIMLNIAVVPDDVVKEVKFYERGWAETFKKDMENYKA